MSEDGHMAVSIVGLTGVLIEFSMPSSTAFWDLKHSIKAALGIQKGEQKLLVGLDAVDHRWSLDRASLRASRCCVTLVRESAQCIAASEPFV